VPFNRSNEKILQVRVFVEKVGCVDGGTRGVAFRLSGISGSEAAEIRTKAVAKVIITTKIHPN
jgi:hypothetical protein